MPRHPALAGFRPAAAAIAVAAAFGLQSAPVRAQPVGGQAIAGQASFARNGNNLVVTTQNAAGTSHSAINWQSFSVPAGSLTRFNQPTAASTSINRVLGPDPSAIFGTLSSNGRLVLVNPAGIAVGAGAVVDTAGFTASTLAMSEADAIAGRLRFAGNGGALQVDGAIVARSGDVVLIAPNVQTGVDAVVQANGATLLAAGQKVEITGRGLEGIRLEVQAPENKAVNLGTLQGDAVGIFAGTLKHSGLVQARAVTAEGGKVLLRALGDNLVSGAVEAAAANGRGGSIDVLGQRVGLLAGAALDASGAAGGGQVRVGGDYQGKNPDVQNATRTYMDAQASIKADATQDGKGGRVIVWSDEATRMDGQISARGGAQGGDGGFVEVSGKQYLAFTGRADTRAPQGRAGMLLLDPNDIEIGNGPPDDVPMTFVDPDSEFSGGSGTSHIDVATLNLQLGIGNVFVTTSGGTAGPAGGQITLLAGTDINWSASTALGLHADKGIQLDGTITASSASSALSLEAMDGGIFGANVVQVAKLYAYAQNSTSTVANAGKVLLTGNNKVGTLAGQVVGTGSEFTFNNTQALTIGSTSGPYASGTGIVAAGNITLATSSGPLKVNDGAQLAGTGIALTATDPADGDLLVGTASMNASGGAMILNAARDIGIATVAGTTPYVYITSAPGSDITFSAGRNIAIGQQAGTTSSYNSTSVQSGRKLTITAGQDITASVPTPVTNQPYVSLNGSGGAGGGVAINAGGVVNLGGYTSVYSNQSPLDVTAGAGILGTAIFSSRGTLNGTIHLTATNGAISTGSISSAGSYSGIQGGEVRLVAKGDVSTGAISSYGAYGSAGYGGAGGSVYIESQTGSLGLANVNSAGGANYSSLGAGGSGGAVTLRALGSGGQVTVAGVAADGGYSYQDGGSGGAIVIQSAGAMTVSGNTTALGGSSGSGGGGNGGAGGSLDASAANGNIALAYADVSGGSSSLLGNGGNAGSITVSALGTGGVALQYNMLAHGGPGSSNGSGGNGGAVLVQAGGDVQLKTVDAGGGGGGNVATAKGGDGGGISITSNNGNLSFGTKSGTSITSSGGAMVSGGYAGSLGAGGQGGAITLSAMGTGAGAGKVLVTGSLSAQGGYTQYGNGGDARTGSPSNAITVTAQRDVDISFLYADGGTQYGGPGGLGGKASVTSAAGNILLGSASAEGSQGGDIRLTASGGNIQVTGVDVNGRQGYSLAPGGNGGSIVVDAGGTATATSTLYAIGGGSDTFAGNGGSIVVTAGGAVQVQGALAYGGYAYTVAGGGNGGAIQLHSAGGDVSATSGIDASGSYGGNGGSILAQADAGNIALQQATASGGYVGSSMAGGNGGSIVLRAPGTGPSGGNVVVTGGLDVQGGSAGENSTGGRGGTITVQVDKQIQLLSADASGGSVNATLGSAGGGAGGSVLLSSATGSIGVAGLINASGGSGSPGGAGGSVQVQAPAGSASIYEIYAQGGWGNVPGAAGGTGGMVDVQVQGELVFSDSSYNGVYADGGEGSGASGGRGGNVLLRSYGGNISLTDSYSSYGISASGGGGSTGGAGGTITAEAAQDLTALLVQANGGEASGGAGAGRGGDGGSVHLRTGGQLHTSYVYAMGGSGGNGLSAGQAGGAGGTGGTVDVVVNGGDQAFDGLQLAAAGGNGGDAFYDGTNSVAGGTGGTGGAVTLTAFGGSLSLSGAWLAASGGMTGYDSSDSSAATMAGGGSITALAASDLRVDANQFTGGAAFTGRAGGNVDVTAPIFSGGGAVLLSAGDAGTPTPQPAAAVRIHALIDSTAGGIVPGGAIALQARGDVVLDAAPTAISGGQITVTSGGTLQLLQAVTSDAAGDAVVLSANALDVGPDGTLATPNGRWLTYLPGPDGNNFGSLASGNYALWGRSYTVNPPVTVAEPGNRFLFAFQPTVDIVAQATSKIYDGTPLAIGLGYTNTPLVDAAAYGDVFLQDVFTGSLQAPATSKNAGNYTIALGTLGIAGYAVGSFTGNVATITPRALNVTASASNKVYDGNTAATVAGLTDDRVAGDMVTIASLAANFNDKNVGTAKPVTVSITASGPDAANYTVPGSTTTSADISPRALSVTASAANKVYDGTVAALISLFDDRVAGDALTLSAAASSFNDKNVGSGKTVGVSGLALTGADAGNYSLANTTATSSANITSRSLAVVVNAQNKVYDATTAAAVSVTDDRIASDSLTASVGASNFSDKNVGPGKTVILGAISLSGADAGNYTLASPPITSSADITKRTLLVSASAQNKVYDATTAATASVADDHLSGDSVTVAVGSATFADKNVGNAKPVTLAGLTLSGADAGNYAVASSASTTADITKRPLALSVSAQNKVYDATTTAATSTSDDHLAGDSLAVTVGGANFADKNVGSGKAVALGAVTLAGADAGNYALANAPTSTSADITPAPVTVAANNLAKAQGTALAFSGTEFSASGLQGSESIASVSLASAGAPTEAPVGAYAITPSAAVGANGFLASNYSVTYLNGALAVFSPAQQPQVNGPVETFSTLFIDQVNAQNALDKKKTDIGKDDIVVTDTACKPS